MAPQPRRARADHDLPLGAVAQAVQFADGVVELHANRLRMPHEALAEDA